MKIYVLSFLLFFSFNSSFSQLHVKTYYENAKDKTVFYADNNENCVVSIKIKLQLENLHSSTGVEKIFVLPANAKQIELTTLTKIDKNKKYKVSGSTWYNYGNHFQKKYDTEFAYSLPYLKGESYCLYQGYNGSFSHQNKKQLDFTMPIGTKIVAARKGVVIKVVDKFNRHCGTEDCEKFNNLIYIFHEDGTIAEYVHIKRQGAKVRVGEQVKRGQIIAESGNVGWSTGPHLHFSVFLQRLGGTREYVKTKFELAGGLQPGYLVEKEKYTKDYN
ncbi:M23 family metallopeptidase [Lacinutrix himadriensis]|uniref:M23 family metallopeptidase n=1 Tax=Lacinutrix himadriensis TaxID=641549 RepID=UPI0006E176EE|nr:M23 family metallopeptidase [Lacinutrix himadriensis]